MVGLMTLMIVTAIGPIRQKFHNRFEHVHRFAGWTLLALFWAHNVAMVRDAAIPLTSSLAFWLLCLITLSIASPWITLKKVPIEVEKPSNHAVGVHFNYGDTPFPGSSNALSLSPLREWHSFANIPTPGTDGYRLVISRAGDWTGRFIDNPPDKVWVKGITTSGVARIEVLFKKVVYVGTGSGIGPILPHLLAHDVPNKLIWSTRSPRKTYGDKLVDEIEANTDDALIWDTDARGKPDLSKLALEAVAETGAEAVIVISNQKLTRGVIYDMERQGIPAFGAIWDS
jgi:predicted ferric reductase